MNVVIFHDAEDSGANEGFDRWCLEHPDGRFINYGSEIDMMLHKVGCAHFVFREPRSLTSYKKVCADSLADLQAWATSHSSTPLGFCRTCSPRA